MHNHIHAHLHTSMTALPFMSTWRRGATDQRRTEFANEEQSVKLDFTSEWIEKSQSWWSEAFIGSGVHSDELVVGPSVQAIHQNKTTTTTIFLTDPYVNGKTLFSSSMT